MGPMLSPRCTSSRSAPPHHSADLRPPRVRLLTRVVAAGLCAALPVLAHADYSPDAALARMLDAARDAAAAPGTCTQPGIDRLVRIFCTGQIRVGVRDDYPLFSTRIGETRQGYEVDVARAVAHKLGVD